MLDAIGIGDGHKIERTGQRGHREGHLDIVDAIGSGRYCVRSVPTVNASALRALMMARAAIEYLNFGIIEFWVSFLVFSISNML